MLSNKLRLILKKLGLSNACVLINKKYSNKKRNNKEEKRKEKLWKLNKKSQKNHYSLKFLYQVAHQFLVSK